MARRQYRQAQIGAGVAMNKPLRVGDISIHRIVELEGPFLPALDVFPTLSAKVLEENRHCLRPKPLVKMTGWSSVSNLMSCARRIISFWLTVASATTR
jgi:hypothetical protein